MRKKYFLTLIVSFLLANANGQSVIDKKETSKTIFNLLQKHEYAKVEEYFDTAFVRRCPVKRLEAIWSFWEENSGAYVNVIDINANQLGRYFFVSQMIQFEKRKLELKISFNKYDKVANMSFLPNEPKEKYMLPSYYDSLHVTEQEVRIVSGDYVLPGILALPKSGKKFPAVVLVHGSGPNDLDETVRSTKIFKDIALGLSSKGVAVLRYNKRTKVYSQKILSKKLDQTPNEESIEDVIVAVQTLKMNPLVDTNRIFLLGHGFGGMLLPRIAKQLPNLAGLFLVAANARPLEEVFYDETKYLVSLDSMTPKKIVFLDTLKGQVTKIKNLNYIPGDTSKGVLMRYSKAYWAYLNKYHQTEVAKELSIPIYILHGERDYQVTMEDYNLWNKELSQKKSAHFKLYPGLNHLLQEGEGKSIPKEYDKHGNVPLYFISDLFNWMTQSKR